uniref:Uncharacterized protein n=1 Tax=Quercus lobata TaxID=97700 RepID=A0A7N2R1S4_QUELO
MRRSERSRSRERVDRDRDRRITPSARSRSRSTHRAADRDAPTAPITIAPIAISPIAISPSLITFTRYSQETLLDKADRSLAIADDNGFEYDNVIVYKGQFYVIDTLGNVSWIDNSSLKLVPFLPLLYFGDELYKQMLCVDGAAIEKPITLKPEEEWTGRLQLLVLPSSFCSEYLNF